MPADPLPPLPEPVYYAAVDYETRPRLLHTKAEVVRHLAVLSEMGGKPVPWEGNVTELVAADQLRAAVLEERERCAKVCEEGSRWDWTPMDCAAAIRATSQENEQG
jgi:hypothetical protein